MQETSGGRGSGRETPLRTLLLSSCVLGGGAGWSFYYLLKHLDRSRFDPLVVVPERGIFGAKFDELGLRVHTADRLHHRTAQLRFSSSNLASAAASYVLNVLDVIRLIPELARLMRRERIELLYCNNMMVKILGVLAAQMAGVPCVLHVRNLHERFAKVMLYGSLARLPVVKQVIANSSASAEPYRRHVPQKVTVVHNGIDLADYAPEAVPRGEFRRQEGIPQDAVVVGFTGHLTPRKGLDTLIRAAAALVPARPKLLFVAIGRVPFGSRIDCGARYEALARELGIAERFRFAGFREDVRPAVADFDVLALPSFQEPFGRSVIEAMALGVPVVASRVGGLPEILTDGRDGLLVPAGDVGALAQAIGSLVDDPQRRQALAQAALARVRESFDVEVLSRRIQDLLMEASRR